MPLSNLLRFPAVNVQGSWNLIRALPPVFIDSVGVQIAPRVIKNFRDRNQMVIVEVADAAALDIAIRFYDGYFPQTDETRVINPPEVRLVADGVYRYFIGKNSTAVKFPHLDPTNLSFVETFIVASYQLGIDYVAGSCNIQAWVARL